MKSAKATGCDSIPARLLKDAANEISRPIAYLINSTISTCMIPSERKSVKATPIHQSGDKSDPTDYRLISVLLLISKAMECVIQSQLVGFFLQKTIHCQYINKDSRRNILPNLPLYTLFISS